MAGGITHSWNGSVLSITSDSGTTSVDLKGPQGDTGPRGPQGPAGQTESVAALSEDLNSLKKRFKEYAIEAGTTSRFTFTNTYLNGFIMAQGAAGKIRGCWVFSGYAVGGEERSFINCLLDGAYISATICPVNEDVNATQIEITNANTANGAVIQIFMLDGEVPAQESAVTAVGGTAASMLVTEAKARELINTVLTEKGLI